MYGTPYGSGTYGGQVAQAFYASVADSVSLSDSPSELPQSFVDVFDEIALSESVGTFIGDAFVSAVESLVLTDAVEDVESQVYLVITENLAVSDPYDIWSFMREVYETVTVTDTVTMEPGPISLLVLFGFVLWDHVDVGSRSFVSVVDAIGLSDSLADIDVDTRISVIEALTASDSVPSVGVLYTAIAYETLVLTENPFSASWLDTTLLFAPTSEAPYGERGGM